MTVCYCIKGIWQGEENRESGGKSDSSMVGKKSTSACILVLRLSVQLQRVKTHYSCSM